MDRLKATIQRALLPDYLKFTVYAHEHTPRVLMWRAVYQTISY